MHNTHTTATAACSSFQHNRITAGIRKSFCIFLTLNGFFNTRNSRYANRMSYQFRFNLVAHLIHHDVVRTDKFNTCFLTFICKLLVFCQETVTRVNCIYTLCNCQFNNFGNAKICINRRFTCSYLIRLIRHGTEKRFFILCGINSNSSNAKFFTCTEHTNGNFATVCHQNSFKFFHKKTFSF